MEAAYNILKGKHIAKGVRGIIIPATMAVYKECILRDVYKRQAAAGGADDGDALAGLDVQRQALDERAVGQIAERDVLDLDVAVRHELCGVRRFGSLRCV